MGEREKSWRGDDEGDVSEVFWAEICESAIYRSKKRHEHNRNTPRCPTASSDLEILNITEYPVARFQWYRVRSVPGRKIPVPQVPLLASPACPTNSSDSPKNADAPLTCPKNADAPFRPWPAVGFDAQRSTSEEHVVSGPRAAAWYPGHHSSRPSSSVSLPQKKLRSTTTGCIPQVLPQAMASPSTLRRHTPSAHSFGNSFGTQSSHSDSHYNFSIVGRSRLAKTRLKY